MYIGDGYELPPQEGWVCPKCGRVNAPWAPFCPCYDGDKKVVYSTDTTGSMTAVRWTNCTDCGYETGSPNCPFYGTATAKSGCYGGIKVPKISK